MGEAAIGVAGPVTYAFTQDRKLYAFDRATGKVLWNIKLAGEVNVGPTIASGMLFAGEGRTGRSPPCPRPPASPHPPGQAALTVVPFTQARARPAATGLLRAKLVGLSDQQAGRGNGSAV